MYTDYLNTKFPPLVDYIITESVRGHLKNIACAIFIKRYPVLLQGPTSSGKTSLVQYLASLTGHEFICINNHDHTNLQEYFGSCITNSSGMLEFQEGPLVKAIRNGHWIVLDELNLAPSDVLEALNRLLDDNRELFVPEIQESIHAHPSFMLFTTQNPPILYAGRKMLSRAFQNRFVEIHVDEIPESECSIILEQRCKIPKSYAEWLMCLKTCNCTDKTVKFLLESMVSLLLEICFDGPTVSLGLVSHMMIWPKMGILYLLKDYVRIVRRGLSRKSWSPDFVSQMSQNVVLNYTPRYQLHPLKRN